MRRASAFSAFALTGTGIYFLIQNMELQLFENQHSWQVFIMIIGGAFLFHSFRDKDTAFLLPGLLLTGFGGYFLLLGKVSWLPSFPAALLLISGVSLLAAGAKQKSGYQNGMLLVLLGTFLYFFTGIVNWLVSISPQLAAVEKYWPIPLIITGFYLLFLKRR
ncbi:hypothetical protein GJU40_19055 [Bacillus lacus]|uniref:DUF5668 domain-containing protein n=1 Tax=Metabacillus lacus TaxID=1983721 RepID=A0A7X2M1E9_9BACI|nr:DUF5668 domain-containing protein [Metabacillus lacus]MRX74224.1 hypothetical protein [Metabacillus lacus]